MNFDEFNTYICKKLEKLDEIAETVEDGEMPLKSYTGINQKCGFIHFRSG